MVPIHQTSKLKLNSVTEKPNLWSICRSWKCKIRLKMSCISLSKLGFTLKKIDLSVFSSLQRYFLPLPDFLLFNRASAPEKRAQRSPIRKENWNLSIQKKREVQSKADHNSVYCFFLTVFRLALPAFFSKPENMQDRRPRFLQLIYFSNLSMPENLVMTSPTPSILSRLWVMGKKKLNRLAKGVLDIAFRLWRKKKKKKNI